MKLKNKAPFRRGDRVLCVWGSGGNNTGTLREGEIYTVSQCVPTMYEECADFYVGVEEDILNCGRAGWLPSRFVLVKDEQ